LHKPSSPLSGAAIGLTKNTELDTNWSPPDMTVLGVVDLEEIIKLQKPMMNANKASRPSNLNGINDSNVLKSPKKDMNQHSTSFISLGDNLSKSPSRKVNNQIDVSLSQQLLAV
jgi:hypothetical protein